MPVIMSPEFPHGGKLFPQPWKRAFSRAAVRLFDWQAGIDPQLGGFV